MKCYNIQNYIRYKEDVKQRMKRIDMTQIYDEYTRDELIIKFMPLVENLARKFSTAQQASGVMNINDLIQEGNKNLVIAVDKIDWDTLYKSDDIEKTINRIIAQERNRQLNQFSLIYFNKIKQNVFISEK